jgi:hypothetical protein
LSKSNFSIPPADKTRKDLAVGINPLPELRRNDRFRVLAFIKSLDKVGRLGSAAAFIKGPANQSAVLVQVKLYVIIGHIGYTRLEFLYEGSGY